MNTTDMKSVSAPREAVAMAAAGTSRWYWINNGKTTGPIAWAELQRLAQSGRLRANDLVLRDGRQHWQPARTARDVEEFAHTTTSPQAATPVAGPPNAEQPGTPDAWFADPNLDKHSFSLAPRPAVNSGRLLTGLLLCGGGIAATVLGYNAAVTAGGGRYVIFTGPIIWGLVLMVQSFAGGGGGDNGASEC
jgi:hypothetical protein